jgi:hypothetical protein
MIDDLYLLFDNRIANHVNSINVHVTFRQTIIYKCKGKEICRLSQLRIVYYVYGIYIYNIFESKGTIFR